MLPGLGEHDGEPGSCDGLTLEGVVVDVAFRGVDRVVTVDADDATGTTVRLTADVRDSALTASPGDRILLRADAAHVVALAG
ncbi:TOBE domain-containing protein [Litorihabitans aurantiacus]|uniref:TOBE domain-containing protein n=1 Tax=Litorihabitans aurantiacus TaxID=1930061 RepID=UPI003D679F1A